jgi:zinc protease
MNYILGGGGFRPGDGLDPQRRLGYSVYSFFGAEKSHGSFQFVMQTKNSRPRRSHRHESARFATAGERTGIERRQSIWPAVSRLVRHQSQVAGFLTQVEYFGLGLDFADRYTDLIRKVSREDVQRVAKQFLQPEKIITVIVGNQKKITPK